MSSSGDSIQVGQPVASPISQPATAIGGWCVTQVRDKHFTYTWTINNFRFYSQSENQVIYSSLFSTGATGQEKWRLELYLHPADLNDKILALYLGLLTDEKTEIWAEYEFSIINGHGQETHTMKDHGKFTKRHEHGFRNFMGLSYLLDEISSEEGLLPNNSLTIRCRMRVLVDTVNIHGHVRCEPNQQLSDQMGQLLLSGSCSDVTLFAGSREFPAHKAVLAARSPVFRAMFEHELKESQHNRVEIDDVDEDVMQEMLAFIYTGSTDGLKDQPGRLLAAADKYQLQRLKSLCEEQLSLNMTAETAAEVLLLADRHSAEQLKSRAMHFISSRGGQVLETPGWNALSASHPQLIVEAFQSLVMQS